jgi:hypothetical protein
MRVGRLALQDLPLLVEPSARLHVLAPWFIPLAE